MGGTPGRITQAARIRPDWRKLLPPRLGTRPSRPPCRGPGGKGKPTAPSNQRPDTAIRDNASLFGGKREVNEWQENERDVGPGPGGRPGSV